MLSPSRELYAVDRRRSHRVDRGRNHPQNVFRRVPIENVTKGRCEMAFVFHHRLATPLWALAFFAVALTSPPAATPLLMVLGIAVTAFTIAGLVPWLRPSRSVAHVVSHRQRDNRSTALSIDRGTCVRTPDDARMSRAEDALDFVRMDDDGGWQIGGREAATRHGDRR